MVVAVKGSLGVAVRDLITGEIPDDEGLVTATRQEHVGAIHQSANYSNPSFCCGVALLQRSRKGGDPAIVALEGASEDKLLAHDRVGRGQLLMRRSKGCKCSRVAVADLSTANLQCFRRRQCAAGNSRRQPLPD